MLTRMVRRNKSFPKIQKAVRRKLGLTKGYFLKTSLLPSYSFFIYTLFLSLANRNCLFRWNTNKRERAVAAGSREISHNTHTHSQAYTFIWQTCAVFLCRLPALIISIKGRLCEWPAHQRRNLQMSRGQQHQHQNLRGCEFHPSDSMPRGGRAGAGGGAPGRAGGGVEKWAAVCACVCGARECCVSKNRERGVLM